MIHSQTPTTKALAGKMVTLFDRCVMYLRTYVPLTKYDEPLSLGLCLDVDQRTNIKHLVT